MISINVKQAAPIGVYDSGVGGLTVWSTLQTQLPNERVIYYGDTAHVPYGDRPASQILEYSREIINFLSHQGVKLVVAACNTSSALALPQLVKEAPVPLLGMIEPAMRAALKMSQNGRIGLMGTIGTVKSGAHASFLRALKPDAILIAQACPRLVPLIEAGQRQGPLIESAVEEYVKPLLTADVDCILLGCTHYPLITEVFQAIAGDVRLIDPSVAVVAQLEGLLAQMRLQNHQGVGTDTVYVSAAPERFIAVASKLLPSQQLVKQVQLAPVHMV